MWAKSISLLFGCVLLCFVAIHKDTAPVAAAVTPATTAPDMLMPEEAVIARYADTKVLEIRQNLNYPDTTEYPSFRDACTVLEMSPHQLSQAIEQCQLIQGTCFILEYQDLK